MSNHTRDQILESALTLFNQHGEPSISTNHIAGDIEISPGNLYYHFRNKDHIIEQLFHRFETRMNLALSDTEEQLPSVEDIWRQLHIVFECIWDFRFLHRDIIDILGRNRKLRIRYARILQRATHDTIVVLQGMVKANVMQATNAEIDATATNILVLITFWLNYASVRGERNEATSIRQGVVQVLMLLSAFMRDAEREHLNQLCTQQVTL